MSAAGRRPTLAEARPQEPSRSKLVTVVVPALNEESALGACLDSILCQSYEWIEVLVVDGGSRDGTRELVHARAARDARVRLLDNPARIVPAALNVALAAARGTWLVRVDAHAAIPTDYVERAVTHLATGCWGGVGGRKNGIGRTSAGKAIAAAMASRFGVGNSTYHHGTDVQTVEHVPFGAYPVGLVRRLGGWDERFAVNQDFEFDYRVRQLGHELLFDPSLEISWECRQSMGALYRQYRRYGAGKVAVAAAHPKSVRPRHLAAPTLVALLSAAGAAAMLGFRWVPAAVVGPYGAVLLVAAAKSAPQVEGTPGKLLLPVAFAAMHVGWGVGFWRGVLGRIAHGGSR